MKHSLINEDPEDQVAINLLEGSQLSSNKAGIFEAPICYLQTLSTLFYSWLLKNSKNQTNLKMINLCHHSVYTISSLAISWSVYASFLLETNMNDLLSFKKSIGVFPS